MTEDEADALYARIGARVAALRSDCGATQSHVAEWAGLTRSSIANLEAGRQRIPVHALADIADGLGVTVTDLMGDVTTGRAPDGLRALCMSQTAEIQRLKNMVRDARRTLGDSCI